MNREVIERIIIDEDENYINFFNLYYVNLISADTCISIDACERNLSRLYELKDMITKIESPKQIKKDYLQRIELGISIVENDIEAIKNGDMGC